MGPKKKGGASKEAAEPPKKEKVIIRENWVNINFQLLNWKYMNFTARFKEDTHIFTLKKLLQERHGKMDDLKICFHSYAEDKEVTDEMLTLKQCGIKGIPIDRDELASYPPEGIPTVHLLYDFVPNNFSDPVLLYHR